MPGLLRGVARTAVVAGTASAVSGRVQRRQAEKFAGRDAQIYADREQAYAQQAPAAPGYAQPVYAQPAYAQPVYSQPAPAPAAPAPQPDMVDQLSQLGALRDSGVLTDEEFAAAKAKVLAG